MSRIDIASSSWRLHELPSWIERLTGFPEVLAALREGHSATVDGAWGSCCALVAATLARHVPRTLVVVTAHIADVDDLREDIATFCGGPVESLAAWDLLPRELSAGDDTYGRRLRLLTSLGRDEPPRVVVTSIQALMQPVPSRASITSQSRLLRVGDTVSLDELVRWLVERGFARCDVVELPGEISLRGGIFDVFPPDLSSPVRIELFGDQVESIRTFDVETQRSIERLQALSITAAGLRPAASETEGVGSRFQGGRRGSASRSTTHPAALETTPDRFTASNAQSASHTRAELVHFCDHVPAGSWFMLVEPHDIQEQGRHYLNRLDDPRGYFIVEQAIQPMLRMPSIYTSALGADSMEQTCHLRVESIERFSGALERVKRELDDVARADHVLVACHNEGEIQRLREILGETQLAQSGRLHFDVGHVRAGFRVIGDQGLGIGDQGLGAVCQPRSIGFGAGSDRRSPIPDPRVLFPAPQSPIPNP